MKVTEADLGGPCQCVFRDERCRYAGPETWCDNHAKRCEQLGNLANYRGWPTILGLPSLSPIGSRRPG